MSLNLSDLSVVTPSQQKKITNFTLDHGAYFVGAEFCEDQMLPILGHFT